MSDRYVGAIALLASRLGGDRTLRLKIEGAIAMGGAMGWAIAFLASRWVGDRSSNLYNLLLESHVTSSFSIQSSSAIFQEIGVETTHAKTFTSRGIGKTDWPIYSDLKVLRRDWFAGTLAPH
ncbi:MAG: hypothetical protein AAGD25_20205 [Cyanobacteria bacterium P01_F01_bin.150]